MPQMVKELPLSTRLVEAWEVAPEEMKPLLSDAYQAVLERDRLLSKMRDIATAALYATQNR